MNKINNVIDSRHFKISGIEVDNLTFAEAVSRIIALAREHRSQYVVTPNADHIVKLQKDSAFRDVYRDAALVVADGMPLLWASRWLGTPLKERITGADLLPYLCAQAAQHGLSVYLLGAPPGVAQQAADKLSARHPSLKIVGVYSPPFGFEHDPAECQRIVEQINRCEPAILFVGVGCPKQEFWIANYRHLLKTGVMLGVGAAIAFAAGTEKRAPLFMQKTGLEWLYRLAQDPKRLTRRYLEDFTFFLIVYREWRQRMRSK